jgi:hypothetical protein
MVHGKTHGLLRMKEQQAVLLHIEELMLSDKADLPEESRFLLEFDLGRLKQSDFETQCYWAAAVSAARNARQIQLASNTDTSSGNNVITNPVHRQTQTETTSRIDPQRASTVSGTRPSPAIRYALEASNKARKPD